MNTITIELCAEDRARLDNIMAALQNSGTPYSAPTVVPQEAAEQPQEAPKAEAVETPAPEAEKPTEEPAAPAEVKPAITLDQIRQKVTYLMAAGGDKKDAARDIVKSYAANISGLPEDKWPEIWDKLTELES